MREARLALVQNQVGVDGRSRVLGEVVRVANEMGIVPDVHTLASDASVELWRRSQGGGPFEFQVVRPVSVPFVRGYIYQTVLHNWLSQRRLAEYDVLVNSNDFLGFLPTSVRRIHYIHFPLSQVFHQVKRYQKPHWKLATLPVRLLTSRAEGQVLPDDITCTNSAFCAGWIARQWPGVEAEVLPPPVEMPDSPRGSAPRDIDVVTLGAINPDKGQLRQVRIAAQLPDRSFVLIGYASAPAYHETVMRTIRELGLSNVEVITDASHEQVQDYLARARVILHTKRDEHFGIGIAEGVGRGCIPVIHDSGGQTEIVPDPRLRYQDDEEAVRILARLLGEDGYTDEERAALRKHVARFRPEAFRARFATLLGRALGEGSKAPLSRFPTGSDLAAS
jgi:glycosyltransferase involved in cell wall biosynthesis